MDQNFETEVLKAQELVVVDFWAPWCMPCKALGPIVLALAKEYEGKGVKIVKMNIDENPSTPQKFGIMSIPTLLFFKDGQVVDQVIGSVSKEILKSKIDQHL